MSIGRAKPGARRAGRSDAGVELPHRALLQSDTYPGLYVPLPLELVCEDAEELPERLAKVVLALTKMNWTNTQSDGKWPITILAATKVGDILRHLGPADRYEPHYGFDMRQNLRPRSGHRPRGRRWFCDVSPSPHDSWPDSTRGRGNRASSRIRSSRSCSVGIRLRSVRTGKTSPSRTK